MNTPKVELVNRLKEMLEQVDMLRAYHAKKKDRHSVEMLLSWSAISIALGSILYLIADGEVTRLERQPKEWNLQ